MNSEELKVALGGVDDIILDAIQILSGWHGRLKPDAEGIRIALNTLEHAREALARLEES